MQERPVTLEAPATRSPRSSSSSPPRTPLEYEGTYPLPEAQLDRFLFKVLVSYADEETEREILAPLPPWLRPTPRKAAGLQPVLDQGGAAGLSP